MTTFVLATANPHKAEEIRAILGDGIALRPRPPEVPDVDETGDTLVANARQAAIADDTGLEVDALGGAPGVRSARYAGETATDADNVAKLLAALDGVTERAARFRTVALARWPDGTEVVCEGTVEGTVTTARRGDAGFGYDPVFVPTEGDGRTFAEMTAAEKHGLSHRGRAFRALAGRIGPPDA